MSEPGNERDPCTGCVHLRTYACPFQRPSCARHVCYGAVGCRYQGAPTGARPGATVEQQPAPRSPRPWRS